MASKAKSGMSAVRMFPELVVEPPNSYIEGATSYTSAVRDGKGHAEYHIAVVNDAAFTLQVQHAWQAAGTFTEDQSIPSAVDPLSGFHVAEVIAPVTKRYLKAYISGTTLGANFEVGWYFLPRASGPTTISSGGGGGGSNAIITSNQQVPIVETETPLTAAGGAGDEFVGPFRDCANYESFGVSVYLERDTDDVTVDIYIEHSKDGTTNIREVEKISKTLTAASPTFKLDRIYSVTRRYYRVRLVNNTAEALGETEALVMLKPIA